MERAERNGFGVALVGHVAAVRALSLGLLSARIPKPPVADTMDVSWSTTMSGSTSAAPKVAQEAPAPSEAPEQGLPEDTAPPPPAPKPEPEPTPPKPRRRSPSPTPPKPKPERRPKPEAQADSPKPKPAPVKAEAQAEAGEAQARETEAGKARKPTRKADARKAEPQGRRPRSPAKARAGQRAGKATGLSVGFPQGSAAGQARRQAAKPKGSRLGKRFPERPVARQEPGQGERAACRRQSARARCRASVALIAAQVKPCYNPPAGGADAASIVTTLNITDEPDGTVASVTAGRAIAASTDANSAYAKQMADAARRAVLRCSPLTGCRPNSMTAAGTISMPVQARTRCNEETRHEGPPRSPPRSRCSAPPQRSRRCPRRRPRRVPASSRASASSSTSPAASRSRCRSRSRRCRRRRRRAQRRRGRPTRSAARSRRSCSNDLKGSRAVQAASPPITPVAYPQVTAPDYGYWGAHRRVGAGAGLRPGQWRRHADRRLLSLRRLRQDRAGAAGLRRHARAVAPRRAQMRRHRLYARSPAKAPISTAASPMSPRPAPRTTASSGSRSWTRTAPTTASSPTASRSC